MTEPIKEQDAAEPGTEGLPPNGVEATGSLAEFGTFPEGDIVHMGAGKRSDRPLKVIRAVFYVPIIPDNIQPDEWIVHPSWTEIAEMIWRIQAGAYKGCKLFLEDDTCMAIGGEGDAFTCQIATPSFSISRMLNPQAADVDEPGLQTISGRPASNDTLSIGMALEAARCFAFTGEMLQMCEWKKLY